MASQSAVTVALSFASVDGIWRGGVCAGVSSARALKSFFASVPSVPHAADNENMLLCFCLLQGLGFLVSLLAILTERGEDRRYREEKLPYRS